MDARTIKVDQRTLSALYHAGLQAELTSRLGVEWVTAGHGISEIAGIPGEVLASFSRRTIEVEGRLEEKLNRFRTGRGRDPTRKERWRLEREAVVDSRPAKPQGPTLTELHEEWRQRVRAMGLDPDGLIERAVSRQPRLEGIDARQTPAMVDEALAWLQASQSTWRPAELVRDLAAALPTTVTGDAPKLVSLLQRLADGAAAGRCVDISPPVPLRGAAAEGRKADHRGGGGSRPHHRRHPRGRRRAAGMGQAPSAPGSCPRVRSCDRRQGASPWTSRGGCRSDLPARVGADRRSGRGRQDHHPGSGR